MPPRQPCPYGRRATKNSQATGRYLHVRVDMKSGKAVRVSPCVVDGAFALQLTRHHAATIVDLVTQWSHLHTELGDDTSDDFDADEACAAMRVTRAVFDQLMSKGVIKPSVNPGPGRGKKIMFTRAELFYCYIVGILLRHGHDRVVCRVVWKVLRGEGGIVLKGKA